MITEKEYVKIHQWLSRTYGKPQRCEDKKCPKVYNVYHWALKKNKEYERNRKNFKRLCNYCHKKYDTRFQNYGKVIRETTGVQLSKKLHLQIKFIAMNRRKKITEIIRLAINRQYPKSEKYVEEVLKRRKTLVS